MALLVMKASMLVENLQHPQIDTFQDYTIQAH